MSTTDAEFEAEATESDSFLDQELVPMLLVAGFVLLLFPEPVTSALGVVLVTVGGGLWVRDLLR